MSLAMEWSHQSVVDVLTTVAPQIAAVTVQAMQALSPTLVPDHVAITVGA
jgi:hypothetical protein